MTKPIDAGFKAAIDEGNAGQIEDLAKLFFVQAEYLKYAVETQASMDVIKLLADKMPAKSDTTVLQTTLDLAIARGEEEEISAVKLAIAIAGE